MLAALVDDPWFDQISVVLKLAVPVYKLKLGDVLDVKFTPVDDKRLRELFVTAQGEIAIESFLSKLKSYWESYTVSFSVYKAKCRLIRGQFTSVWAASSTMCALRVCPTLTLPAFPTVCVSLSLYLSVSLL